MLAEFKKFIMRGNVMDLAIGIIMGTAFTAIVQSLVNDVVMPPIGVILGGVDFSDIAITLQAATDDVPAVTVNIGVFINALINFLIVAVVVFFLVRSVNRLMDAVSREEAQETTPEPKAPSPEALMLEELKAIRVALEKQANK